MATARDKDLIVQVGDSAAALHKASVWVNSKLPLNVTDNYLFEYYILLRLILNLAHNYTIRFVPGTGDNRFNFPRSPANKNGWPMFDICSKSDGILLLQICAGTKVSDIYGKERAPDISFQNAGSSDAPSWKDVKIIWDGKYRKKSSDSITDHEFSSFSRWLEILRLRNKQKPPINLNNLAQLLGNCLITNGVKSPELDAECTRADLKEVTSFYPGKQISVRP